MKRVRCIFEAEVDGAILTIWEGGIGHRVKMPSETFAVQQMDTLQRHERQFRLAKEKIGVAVIDAYGEEVTPVEYIQRAFKAWRSKVGQYLGIEVFENVSRRADKEWW